MKITNAKDLLKRFEDAVVVFTHGQLFQYDKSGNGWTGNWVIDPEMVDQADKVIVYLRDDRSGANKIFIGNFSTYKMSPEKNRYIIYFNSLNEVGTTDSNWFEFADGSQNPVCYVAG